MFLIMRNTTIEETLTDAVEVAIRTSLPPAWSIQFRPAPDSGRMDGYVDLISPSREKVTFTIEVKSSGSTSTINLVDQLTALAARTSEPLLLLTDYLNPTLRAGLADAGISYADGTGWIRIVRDSPLLLISKEGASRAPRTRPTSNTTRLNGRAAGRIIRALLERPVPLGVRELAELTDTSPGSVSKLLPTLVGDGAVERDDAGAVMTVRKRALLDRWTQDYGFLNSNSLVLDYLAPRGLAPVLEELRQHADVCLTGSAAARTYLPEGTSSVVPLTQLACFARDLPGLAADLQLVRTDRHTANVLLTQPLDPQLLAKPRLSDDGLPTAPTSQVLADLVTLPGRAGQEAEQLIDVLATTDHAWRM